MIRCRIIYNDGCLKCKSTNHEMVRIGALYMCKPCFETEFNIEAFEVDSDLGKKYYKWLKVYEKGIE